MRETASTTAAAATALQDIKSAEDAEKEKNSTRWNRLLYNEKRRIAAQKRAMAKREKQLLEVGDNGSICLDDQAVSPHLPQTGTALLPPPMSPPSSQPQPPRASKRVQLYWTREYEPKRARPRVHGWADAVREIEQDAHYTATLLLQQEQQYMERFLHSPTTNPSGVHV